MKRVIRLDVLQVLIALAILVVGCAPLPSTSDANPDFAGVVTGKANYTLHVESGAEGSAGRCVAIWKPGRPISEKVGEGHHSITFQDLRHGDRVQLWFTLSVITDRHIQATVSQIVVVERDVEP